MKSARKETQEPKVKRNILQMSFADKSFDMNTLPVARITFKISFHGRLSFTASDSILVHFHGNIDNKEA